MAFCSNDYLGLAAEPSLADAAARAPTPGASARRVPPRQRPHRRSRRARARLAAFVGMEDALYFSTGYMANIGVMPALVGRGDAIFADKVNHASLVDGALSPRRAHPLPPLRPRRPRCPPRRFQPRAS